MMMLEKIKAGQTRRLTVRPACKTQACPSVTTALPGLCSVPITAEGNAKAVMTGLGNQPLRKSKALA